MHYILNLSKLDEVVKKLKPQDTVTLLTKEDKLDVDVLNVLMSIKSNLSIKRAKTREDAAVLLGYYIGKEEKNVSIMLDDIPEMATELLGNLSKPLPKKNAKKNSAAIAMDELKRVLSQVPDEMPESKEDKSTKRQNKSKKRDDTNKTEKNTSHKDDQGDSQKEVSDAGVESDEPAKSTKPTAKDVKDTKDAMDAKDVQDKQDSPIVSDKPSSKEEKKKKEYKNLDAAIEEIANRKHEKVEQVKKNIISVFRYEDDAEAVKPSFIKIYSDEMWDMIAPFADDLLMMANS